MTRTSSPPETSLSAYRSLPPEMITDHKQEILSALTTLKSATAEQISTHTKIDYWQVSRRLSELERDQKIYKPGLKLPTRTGRMAFIWRISNPEESMPVPTTERFLTGKTVSDYSKEISKYVQPNLF